MPRAKMQVDRTTGPSEALKHSLRLDVNRPTRRTRPGC